MHRPVALVIGTGLACLLASCTSGGSPDGHSAPPVTAKRASAAPGQVRTVAGTGEAGPSDGVATSSGIARPLALAITRDDGLIFLSAMETTAVNVVRPNGTMGPYPSTEARNRLVSVVGLPHSATLLPDGRYLVVDWSGGLSVVMPDGSGRNLGDLAKQTGSERVAITQGAAGKPLAVSAGRVYALALGTTPRLTRLALPAAVDGKVELAAAGDAGRLLLATKTSVLAIKGTRILRTWPLQNEAGPTPDEPTALVSDGKGGAWVGVAADALGSVEHMDTQGKVRIVLTGAAGGCHATPPARPKSITPETWATTLPKQFALARPAAILPHGSQLYIADRDCNRVLTLGLPVD